MDNSEEQPDARTHIVVSPTILALFLSAIGFGGAGTWGVVERYASQEQVPFTHELQDSLRRLAIVEQRLSALERTVDQGTRDRWTGEDHRQYNRSVEARFQQVERSVYRLESAQYYNPRNSGNGLGNPDDSHDPVK